MTPLKHIWPKEGGGHIMTQILTYEHVKHMSAK